MSQTEISLKVPKSKAVAYLLWFFFGQLGIHRFYTGRTKTGIIQLILGGLGWLTTAILIGWVLLVPLWIWLVVDIFLIPSMCQTQTVVRGVIEERNSTHVHH